MAYILDIRIEVEKSLAINDIIDQLQKVGFTLITVKIDLAEPLKLGVLIEDREGSSSSPLSTKIFQ